jgi:hypothetical protein
LPPLASLQGKIETDGICFKILKYINNISIPRGSEWGSAAGQLGLRMESCEILWLVLTASGRFRPGNFD